MDLLMARPGLGRTVYPPLALGVLQLHFMETFIFFDPRVRSSGFKSHCNEDYRASSDSSQNRFFFLSHIMIENRFEVDVAAQAPSNFIFQCLQMIKRILIK